MVAMGLTLAGEATVDMVRQMRVCFQEWLWILGAAADLVNDLGLAVYEALANVVDHAYPPDDPHRWVYLQARLHGDQLLITVTDHGCWRTSGESEYRGHGLAIMRSFTEVYLHSTARGTTVQMRAAFPRRLNGPRAL